MLTLLVVACAAGGGGGGGGGAAGPSVSAFSHNSYTFAADLDDSAILDAMPQPVGRVLPNNNRIRSLVAARLGIADPQQISALSENNGYSISFSIDAAGNSDATTFFSITDEGVINVVNPFPSAGFTFGDIRGYLTDNSINVKLTITVASPATSTTATPVNAVIESIVKVRVLDSADFVDLTDTTKPSLLLYNRNNIASAASAATNQPSAINFQPSGNLDENTKKLEDAVFFDKPDASNVAISNLVRAFGITRNPDRESATGTAAQVTLFYALRSINNNNACGNGDIYIDNNDLTVKAGVLFNYENVPEYDCRLAVSTDGVTYIPLVFALDNTVFVNVLGDLLSLANTPNIAIVSENAGDSASCSAPNACYYGDLRISINDVAEAPMVSLADAATAFAGSAEGVGPVVAYQGFGSTNYSGSLATGDAAVNSVQVNILDEDNDPRGAAANKVSWTVNPSHGTDAFNVNRMDESDVYNLVVNNELLDYEAFAPAQLTADGKAIYKITITAADNETATLTTSATFDFEVTDVKFTPVFVNPINISDDRPPATAFFKEDNIRSGANSEPIYLLSGISGFVQRNRIGRLVAVDPETGKDDNFVYTIDQPISTNIHSNIKLIQIDSSTNNLGRRLIVAGTGLLDAPGNLKNVTIRVATSESISGTTKGANRTVQVSLAVDDSQYADASDISENLFGTNYNPSITFDPAVSLVASVNETNPAGDNVVINFGQLDVLNTTAIINTDVSLTPQFSFVDQRLIDLINERFPATTVIEDIGLLGINLAADQANFDIDSASGRITVRRGNAEFNFPRVFSLPVVVTPASTDLQDAFAASMFDITVATVVTNDVNTAPVVLAPNRTPVPVTGLTSSIPENVDVGTPLTSFVITDDNLEFSLSPIADYTAAFTGSNAATANRLLNVALTIATTTTINGRSAPMSLIGTITTKAALDFETTADVAALADLNITIIDTGSYTSFGPAGLGAPVPTTGSILTTTVPLNIAVTDVAESPVLEADDGPFTISENARAGANVLSARGPVVIRLTNPLDFLGTGGVFDSSSLAYTLTSPLAATVNPILALRSNAQNNQGDLRLEVIDADRLENFGDGQTFPVTITATADGERGRSTSVTINVKIEDYLQNSQFNADELPSTLTINEQDVASSDDNSFTLDGFSININSLAKDADEFLPVGDKRRVVTPTLALGSATLANNRTAGGLSPTLDKANVIEIVANNGIYTLVVQDTDLIESALFGDITVNLQGGTTASAIPTAKPEVTIAVRPATPKNVEYANANRAAARPPVYALSYTQTPYAEAVDVATIPDDATITAIDASTNFIFSPTAESGVPGGFVNIMEANAVYPTVDLGDRGSFIARNLTTISSFSGNNAAFANDNTSIIINVNSAADLSAGVDILKANKEGDLVDASDEFDAYFNLAVTADGNAKKIDITQKVFTNTLADSTVVTYNALDTIQLYEGAPQTDYTLSYFFRARTAADGTTDASNYALAQFSVEVEATGINARTEVLQVALVPDGENINHAGKIVLLDISGEQPIESINLNQIAVNSFNGTDAYDLIVEFNNPDAVSQNEIASDIVITLSQGRFPAVEVASSAARDGGLIDIKTTSENRIPAAATAVRTI
ncbi:MAG: hypothetical protein K0U41_07295, partial [Gammaproteobacteria bacterium]|nr:hypothetical protein [Gammaproteobacteria bacterium]